MVLGKFGGLLIRTLSKPVANAIKRRAVERPAFRARCAAFAQLYHRVEVTLTMRLMGHEAKSVKPLTEAQAVSAGADILGEGIIFSFAAAVLLFENHRSTANEEKKREQLEARFEEQRQRIAELEDAFTSLRADTLRLMEAAGKFSAEQISSARQNEQRRQRTLADRAHEEEPSAWQRFTAWLPSLGLATPQASPQPTAPTENVQPTPATAASHGGGGSSPAPGPNLNPNLNSAGGVQGDAAKEAGQQTTNK
mmetsp:Transcript_47675/g.95460  ORF Transcript_47675/g.95460 Transcript_47675/m.95460 type:complete len:252 (-) Transcript_47675:21-776(-)